MSDQPLKVANLVSLLDLKKKFVSFVFQPSCFFCGSEITKLNSTDCDSDSSQIVCGQCYDEIVGLCLSRCYTCGAEAHPLNPFGSRCRCCRSQNYKFERAISIGTYKKQLRQCIIDVKRGSEERKAFQLGILLGELSEKFDLPVIDCVVPVPSHWRRRLSRRGVHIADTIADGFCRTTGLKKYRRLLKCTRHTQKQSKLRPGQRIKNVRGAFQVDDRMQLSNMRVLLLDDVMTSGATVNECSRLLLRSGAQSVFVAVAARATGVS